MKHLFFVFLLWLFLALAKQHEVLKQKEKCREMGGYACSAPLFAFAMHRRSSGLGESVLWEQKRKKCSFVGDADE